MCFSSAPSPAYRIHSLPQKQAGSHGNGSTFICSFVAPPTFTPPPWHTPKTMNVETLASLLILVKLAVWGLKGCKHKPPHSDVYH